MNHPTTRLTALVVGVLLFATSGVAAGDPPAGQQQPSTEAHDASFLSAYHFHLSAASLVADDPRFDWDAHFGGDIDIVDYGIGRINLLADYGVTIGSQIRTIDPNQGAYHLAVSASWRRGGTEVHALFDHVSRHLSDRPNFQSVSWNAVGPLVTMRLERGAVSATLGVRATKVVQAAFVDYTWLVGMGADVSCALSRRASLIARADIAPTLVDRQVAGRDAQVGVNLEGGVRVWGGGAGIELFAGWQRRIDPWPLERSTASWPVLGFRFVSR